MYTLLSELYTKYCGYPEYNLAILGLEQTGKTQILRALKDQTSTYMVGLKQQYKPTLGLNTHKVNKNKTKFLVWDLGGKASFRKIWENYYPFTHGVVYLFDNRIVQGFQCLKSIINHQEMTKIPILIFVRNSQFYSQIKQQIDALKGTQPMQGRSIIIELIPHSRQRLYEHLEELYENIKKLDNNIRK